MMISAQFCGVSSSSASGSRTGSLVMRCLLVDDWTGNGTVFIYPPAHRAHGGWQAPGRPPPTSPAGQAGRSHGFRPSRLSSSGRSYAHYLVGGDEFVAGDFYVGRVEEDLLQMARQVAAPDHHRRRG